MTFRSYGISAISLILAASLASSSCTDAACACEPVPMLAGTYHATRLRATPTGQAAVDALAAGATLTLTLSGSGATSGSFFVPASLNNGVAQTLDLTGTYQLTGNHVTFSQNADTFLRDVGWTWQGNTLVTTEAAGGAQFDVVLTRQ